MLLRELFEPNAGGPSMTDRLRGIVLDLLTPLAAHEVPTITIQQIMDELNDLRTGLHIDRALLLDILDPTIMQVVKKVDGDRVHLSMPAADESKAQPDEEAREEEKVRKTAQRQAKKEVGKA